MTTINEVSTFLKFLKTKQGEGTALLGGMSKDFWNLLSDDWDLIRSKEVPTLKLVSDISSLANTAINNRGRSE